MATDPPAALLSEDDQSNLRPADAQGTATTLPIDEEFRKAKRNSLVFSALVIVVALGDLGDRSQTEIKLFGTDLSYDPWLAALLFWLTAAFMLAGYVRASRLVQRNSLDALLGRNVKDLGSLFAKVIASLREAEGELRTIGPRFAQAERTNAEVLQNLRRATDDNANAVIAIRDKLREARVRMRNLASQTDAAMRAAEHPIGEAMIADAIDQLERHGTLAPTLQMMIDSAEQMNGEGRTMLADSEKSLIDQIDKLEREATVVADWYGEIEVEDRGWHFWFDHVPVWVLFFAATFALGVMVYLALHP